jgi:hypothetical protein
MTTLKGGKAKNVKDLKKSLKSGSGSGAYGIREEGATYRFLHEPTDWLMYYEHYDSDRDDNKFIPCVDGCEYCADGNRASKRMLANALDVDADRVVPLKLPVSVATTLVKSYERRGTIMDRDYFLSREGTGLDTEYSVDAEAPSKKNIAKYDLFDLEKVLLDAFSGTSDDDEDDEEEEDTPRSRRRKTVNKKTVRKRASLDDDADDDDEEEFTTRRPMKRRRPMKKSSRRR